MKETKLESRKSCPFESRALSLPTKSIFSGVLRNAGLIPWLSLLFAIGCSSPVEPGASSSGTMGGNANSVGTTKPNAPPLKIALVNAETLQAELALRWQTVSDQALDFRVMSLQEFVDTPTSTIDVLIYPAQFMGTLIERDWIAPVPVQVQKALGGWDNYARREEDQGTRSPWPPRWKALSTYGGKPMAVPLGAPCWVAISRSLDCTPLMDLHTKLVTNQTSTEVSKAAWESFLERAEKAQDSTRSERESAFSTRIASLSPAERHDLIGRYLWIVSTTESRYRGLFDLYKIQSRWSQPEFTRAAMILRRLALLNPSTFFDPPSQAWESVVEGKSTFAIGWPRSDNDQRLTATTSDAPLKLVPILWNGGSGMMASMGRKTRQSANTANFLIWLSSDEQRAALQSKTEQVELIEIDNDRNRVRDDYREYQTLQRLEAGNLTYDVTPRFTRTDRFQEKLADALIQAMQAPETAEAAFQRCRTEWDRLVDDVGRETMRSSLEAASGYAR